MQLIRYFVAQTSREIPRTWLRCPMKFALAFAIFIIMSAAVFAQAPAEPIQDAIVEDVYLARDDGSGKAGEVVETFNTRDIPIYCIVTLAKFSPINVKMNLVAVKVNGVKPETKVVTTGYTTKQGENRVNFRGKPDGVWVAGTYRIDVLVEGKREKSLTFEVKSNSAPAGAMKFAPAKPKATTARKSN